MAVVNLCTGCHRQEYATIAGMIVTQFGRPVPLPAQSGELDDRGSHVSSALDALRGYYGLGSASPSGPGPDYFRGMLICTGCAKQACVGSSASTSRLGFWAAYDGKHFNCNAKYTCFFPLLNPDIYHHLCSLSNSGCTSCKCRLAVTIQAPS